MAACEETIQSFGLAAFPTFGAGIPSHAIHPDLPVLDPSKAL